MASDKLKLTIHTSRPASDVVDTQMQRPTKSPRKRRKSTLQEKLLRNSCLACAMLLGILALGNVEQPWAKNVSGTIEKALTMEIDLDKSLGQLEFVQKLMPESALVFFNLNGGTELGLPVSGELVHSYSSAQPWLMFECAQDAPVEAAADGTVSAVSPMSDGGYGILIDHGNGMESVTACLVSADVQAGAIVRRGTPIGKADGKIYFELRQGGESCDPTEKMGL